MSKYLIHGKFAAKKGQREELSAILLEASKLIESAKGCKLYAIGIDVEDSDAVYITEIWDSKEDHDNSLKVAGVKELINKVMPILDGQPGKGQELELLGGAGL